MEAAGQSVGTRDDVIVERPSNGGQALAAGRAGVVSPASGRGKATVRHISVAPVPDDDVTPSAADTGQYSWRPMRPGYAVNANGAVLIERTVKVEDFDHDDDNDNSFHMAIPTMSLPVSYHESVSGCRLCSLQRNLTRARSVQLHPFH